MQKINWGIIGCGDVTEVKSGPAFNKVPNAQLAAVMRRNEAKVKDYAARHNVPKWYTDAQQLVNDPGVNAIYIATPPDTHEHYTLMALQAGKPVYVEKPMSVNAASAQRMAAAAEKAGIKLSVAHYRREQPLFRKVKQLVEQKAIGDVRYINLQYAQPPLTEQELQQPKIKWRIMPAISGGGLFHDLAPHQLDLMLYFFGRAKRVSGISVNQSHLYDADDMVTGTILFENEIVFTGMWCFNASTDSSIDICTIIGSEGNIRFPIFEHNQITITKNGQEEIIPFDKLAHVQQPMIEKVTAYFLNQATNPCSASDGVTVMEWMDRMAVIPEGEC